MAFRAHLRITKVIRPDELAEQIVPPMTRLGNAITVRGKRLVPKRSWRLHDTIEPSTKVEGSKVVTRVGMGGRTIRGKLVNYGLLVEKGTSRMAAQAFMRPALYQSNSSDLNYSGSPGVKFNGAD